MAFLQRPDKDSIDQQDVLFFKLVFTLRIHVTEKLLQINMKSN
jgi:hypothetical protein